MKWETPVRQSIIFAFGAIEVFIGLRVLLKILGANPIAPLAAWVYDTSNNFLYPFEGIFPSWRFGQLSTFEFSSLFAMFFYAILAYFIFEALAIFMGWSRGILDVLEKKPLRFAERERPKPERHQTEPVTLTPKTEHKEPEPPPLRIERE